MKKIFAITISLILLISILLPVASSCRTFNSSTILALGTINDAIIQEDANDIIKDITLTEDVKDKDEEKPTVKIIKPEANYSYFFNIKLKKLENTTEITGPIIVKVNAESNNGIEKVEFYLDGVLKHVDKSEKYTWLWPLKPRGKDNFTISVIAYDKNGNTSTDSINVTRSQFTPIRNHILLATALAAGLGITIFLKNRNKGVDEVIPVEPDEDKVDGEDSYEDIFSSGSIEKDEDYTFWYIVVGLAAAIATALTVLFFRRRIYV